MPSAIARLVLMVVLNAVLLPWNLMKLLRRRPRWIAVSLGGTLLQRSRQQWLRRSALSIAELEKLRRVLARDRRVEGIVLYIDHLRAGWAKLSELRQVIAGWRALGKRVIAHLSSPGNREYYVATACDQILMDESGSLALTGLAIESSFYGEALRRAGIEPQLEHRGEFKSFAETFTRADMSPAHRQALDAILDGLGEELVSAIASGRQRDADASRELVNSGPYLPAAALATGLVDEICYRDQLADRLRAGRTSRLATHRSYLASRPAWYWPGLIRGQRQIAVLSLEGTIAAGETRDRMIRTCGADTAARALTALRRTRSVAAVVLHVDSRGGSAAASDLIWHAVARLAGEKPVIAHLGDVAASGGYYLVAPCHWIVAPPVTLTGSIGAVAGKFAVEGLLRNLGIGTELLRRGRAAGMSSVRLGYDEVGWERLRCQLEGVYQQFMARVASGRQKDLAEVEEVARGRAWTGADAKSRGLIDQLGTLEDAVKVAAERARRRETEKLVVRDFTPQYRRGWLGLVTHAPASFEEGIEALVGSLAPLLGESVLLQAEVPEVC